MRKITAIVLFLFIFSFNSAKSQTNNGAGESGPIIRGGIDVGYSTTPLVDFITVGYNMSGITGVGISFSGTAILNGWNYYRIDNEFYFKFLAVDYLKYIIIEHKYVYIGSKNKEFQKQSYNIGAGVRVQPFSFFDDNAGQFMTFRLTGGFTVWDNNQYLDSTDRVFFGAGSWYSKWYVEFTMGIETP